MRRRLLCLEIMVFCILWLNFCLIFATLQFQTSASEQNSDFPFTDVPETSPFRAGIDWAVKNNITNGTTPTTFEPGKICERQQILTFAWRYAGSPAAPPTHYADVDSGAYYETASYWALQCGLETGQSSGGKLYFGVGLECSRRMTVIYLWRLAGSPTEYLEEAYIFQDIPKEKSRENRELAMAVGWARTMEITTGTTERSFSPDGNCTRGQIATFLFRFDQARQDGKIKNVVGFAS